MRIMGFMVTARLSDDLPEDTYGHCRPEMAEIRVSRNLPSGQRRAILLHEAMHFIWSKTRGPDDTLTEEEVCTLVENLATIYGDLD